MPIIPRINQTGPLAAAPGVPMTRLDAPRVDNRAVIQAAGNLGRASQMPLDGNDYGAPLRALGAVGEAVMRTGNLVGALAAKKQEATDRRILNQWQIAAEQEANDFEVWRAANPNAPEKWTEEAKRRADGLIAPYLGMKELSQAAKDDLALMGQSWQSRFVSNVETSSTKAIFGLAKGSYVARAQRAFEAGNLEDGRAALMEAEGGGYIHPFEREAMEAEGVKRANDFRRSQAETQADTFIMRNQPEQARAVLEQNADAFEPAELENKVATVEERAMKQKAYNDLLVMANDDPASAASLAIEEERRGKIDATMRVDIENRAQGTLASNRKQATAEYAERIETPGQMPTEAEITMDFRLNDYDREQLRRRIKGATFDQASEFESALAKVMSFKPSSYESEAQAITAATNLEASIDATFSGAYASRLKEELGKRTGGPGQATPSAATDLGPAMATLDQAIEEGGLGEIWKPVMQDGKVVLEKKPDVTLRGQFERNFLGKWWTGESTYTGDQTVKGGDMVPKMEKDSVANAKARAIQKEISETLQVEVKAGKLKDQEAIHQRAVDLFTLKGGKIKPRPAAGPSPVQMDGALPDGSSPTPASGPNPLLPDIDSTLNRYGY